MTRAPLLQNSYRRAAMVIVLLALAARMLVPQGWMPSRAPGQIISICNGIDGMTKAVLGKDGKLQQLPEDEHETSDRQCAFAGMVMAGTLPNISDAQSLLISLLQELPAQFCAVAIGRGLAAPPPPATGPPILF